MTDDSAQLLAGLYTAYDALKGVIAQSDDEMVITTVLRAMYAINRTHYHLSGELIE